MFRKSARGLFDLLMATLAVTTLMTTTPTGALIGRGLRYALGFPSKPTSLISFFGKDGAQGVTAAFTAPEPTSLVASVARAFGAEPAVLKGFALASGANPSSPELAMNLSAEGRSLLLARGAKEADLAAGSGQLRAVSQAIADLTKELGSADAALCALILGLQPVQYAAERVRAERRDPTLEALASHLPPGSRERAVQTVGFALQLATAYGLAWPVPRALKVGSKFGMRIDPISRASSLHNGVDIGMPVGTPIWSAGQGVIKRAGEDGLNGKFLVVDHGRGITSSYCHNSELLVSRGSRVEKGATITNSGNTGRSTGPHLHYVVAIEGVAVDPLALIAEGDPATLGAGNPPAAPKPVAPAPAKPTPQPAKPGVSVAKAGAAPAKAAPAVAEPAPGPAEPPPATTEPAPAPAEPIPAPAPVPTEPDPAPAEPSPTSPPVEPGPAPVQDPPPSPSQPP